MEPLDDLKLGATDQSVYPENAADHRQLVLAMARQARRTLHIHSRELDPAVYDDEEVQETFRDFLLRNRNCRITILVQNTDRMVKQGHALARLADKLPDRMLIRLPDEQHKEFGSAFFVADVTGYIRQPVAERYSAEANFSASFDARKLVKYFDEVWEHAVPDPQLRRLHL
jgi:hypothetical protein